MQPCITYMTTPTLAGRERGRKKARPVRILWSLMCLVLRNFAYPDCRQNLAVNVPVGTSRSCPSS